MLLRLTTIAVVLIMGTASVTGKPLQSDAAAGFYQYDPTNEYAYAPASGSSSDSAEDTHNNGTVEDEATYDDEYSGEQRVAKRSALPDDTTDTHGGDSELAADRSAPGTIALSDLVGAVEHTLVHSVQNLQQAVAIANNVSNATTGENKNSNPTSAVIALPIDFPAGETSSTTTPESPAAIGGGSSSTVLVTVVPEIDSVQSVKPNDPLSVLSIIALSTTTTPNTPQQATTEEGSSNSATQTPQPPLATTTVTSVIQLGDAAANADNNITIIQTINSTQEVHSADSAVQRIQQQHITLFSAGAGVFPSIPSVALANQPRSGHNNGTADEDGDESGSNESNSSEEADGTTHCDDTNGDVSDSSSGDSESDEKPDHHNKLVNKCALSTASKATTSTTTPAPNDEQIAAAAKEILKEKIAEVEAEPVILTQGI